MKEYNIFTDESQYKLASRESKKEDTVIDIGNAKIGGGNFLVIAGPCSVEDYETTSTIAEKIKENGASILRAGAFKPRTSPYSFSGNEDKGIKTLTEIRKNVDIPVVSEITDKSYMELYENIDVLQIGARNMQNFELLKAVGKTKKPIILKRGMGATIDELILSAEYILKEGNSKVILCERGIRTFESVTRNTLDISAIPLLKQLTHLPVIVDPSHATGRSDLVPATSLAAVAAGADGIMMEVHITPNKSVSDPDQALSVEEFSELMPKINNVRKAIK